MFICPMNEATCRGDNPDWRQKVNIIVVKIRTLKNR